MPQECSICGKQLADSPLAGPAHARKHKNRFEQIVGRPPEDYDEVRALFNDGEVPDDVNVVMGDPSTLDEYYDRGQLTPLGTIVLVGVVSGLLLVALAIGVVCA